MEVSAMDIDAAIRYVIDHPLTDFADVVRVFGHWLTGEEEDVD